MAKKQPTGVSKIIWPPEKTFKYNFRGKEELDLEIPLVDNEKEIKQEDR